MRTGTPTLKTYALPANVKVPKIIAGFDKLPLNSTRTFIGGSIRPVWDGLLANSTNAAPSSYRFIARTVRVFGE